MSETQKTNQQTESAPTPYQRRKKKTWIVAGVTTAIFAVLALLGTLLLGGFVGILVGIFYVLLIIVWLPGELTKIRRNFCRTCGEQYDYEDCVAWQVTKVDVKARKTNPDIKSRQTSGVRVEHVECTCTCKKCGNQSHFKTKFDTGFVYTDGTISKKDVAPMIRNYFKV